MRPELSGLKARQEMIPAGQIHADASASERTWSCGCQPDQQTRSSADGLPATGTSVSYEDFPGLRSAARAHLAGRRSSSCG